MGSSFKIAVVVPTLNEADNINGLLQSLVSAGIPAHRVWICDGGSQDKTCALARRVGAKVIRTQRGRGPQLIAGARRALQTQPDVLMFIHGDSRVPLGAAEHIENFFLDPQLGFSSFRSAIAHSRPIYRMMESVINFRTHISRIPYGELGLVVRPGLYKFSGGYPAWPLFEEVDLASRLGKVGEFTQLEQALLTSARRWEEGGPLLVTFRNWVIMMLYLLGASPHFLARFYLFTKMS